MKDKLILQAQRTELTEYIIYTKLASYVSENNNKKLLQEIAQDELRHHDFWQQQTNKKVKPFTWRIWRYYFISRILGLTFGIKLMEHQEVDAQKLYTQIAENNPHIKNQITKIIHEEEEHERRMINLIVEDRFKYIGSMVLGLNDALVELTGALAGLTLALRNANVIAMVGLITGIAASLSMAASEYLSIKTESEGKNPLKAATYTGIAYIFTVLILIIPFLFITNVFISLGISILCGIGIIACFTYYTDIAQNIGFKKRFLEMTALSLSIALISFGIGYVIKLFFNIDV